MHCPANGASYVLVPWMTSKRMVLAHSHSVGAAMHLRGSGGRIALLLLAWKAATLAVEGYTFRSNEGWAVVVREKIV